MRLTVRLTVRLIVRFTVRLIVRFTVRLTVRFAARLTVRHREIHRETRREIHCQTHRETPWDSSSDSPWDSPSDSSHTERQDGQMMDCLQVCYQKRCPPATVVLSRCYARSPSRGKRLLASSRPSVCLSVCPHVSAWPHCANIRGIIYCRPLKEICGETTNLVKMPHKNTGRCTWRLTATYIWYKRIFL